MATLTWNEICKREEENRKYREIINHLEKIVCIGVDVTSKEYANIHKRIRFIRDNKLQ